MPDERTMPLFLELYTGLDRQGPGNEACTLRALSMVPRPGPGARILDLGAGTGTQTFVLARATDADILAIEAYPPFTATLNETAARLGLSHRVRGEVGDMGALPYPDVSFDLIWAEGSIYNVGFEAGLGAWRHLLRPGGHVCVSEMTWFVPDLPPACRDYWSAAYPPIADEASNREFARRAGYRVVGDFRLPPSAWLDDYFAALERNLVLFRARHPEDPDADAVARESEVEIARYREDFAFMGYTFFVLQRVQ